MYLFFLQYTFFVIVAVRFEIWYLESLTLNSISIFVALQNFRAQMQKKKKVLSDVYLIRKYDLSLLKFRKV